ncbi:MAG: HlyC/CorC family transporter, partial [Acetatifactor sp.]|nr:HlyC/CorC family transporter [Acetatifactor sp.]
MEDAGPMAGIIFFVLLLMDIFFYGFDAAVSNLNEKELERRAEEKDVKSRRLLQIIADPDRYV